MIDLANGAYLLKGRPRYSGKKGLLIAGTSGRNVLEVRVDPIKIPQCKRHRMTSSYKATVAFNATTQKCHTKKEVITEVEECSMNVTSLTQPSVISKAGFIFLRS